MSILLLFSRCLAVLPYRQSESSDDDFFLTLFLGVISLAAGILMLTVPFTLWQMLKLMRKWDREREEAADREWVNRQASRATKPPPPLPSR